MKKIQIPVAGKTIRFSVVGLIVYLVLLTILCSLGSWQLRRAEQKERYLRQLEQGRSVEISHLNRLEEADLKTLEYRKVSVSGKYDDAHQFLIDNQVKNGKVGYFVMTPFFISGQDRAVLVNRGWIGMAKNRQELPDLRIGERNSTITGRVNHFPSVGLVLEGADVPSDTWPATVQVVDQRILAERLGYALLDFQIELDPTQKDGYSRVWQAVSIMPPEKHIAYAVQWFALALTLTVLFLWFSFKQNG